MASQDEKQTQPFADIFDEDEAEKSFLLSKPTCLIVLGKPVRCLTDIFFSSEILKTILLRLSKPLFSDTAKKIKCLLFYLFLFANPAECGKYSDLI